MKPVNPLKKGAEYVCKGTCSIFIFTEPFVGWPHMSVRSRRKRIEWAEEIRVLLDVHYPDAPKVCLLTDNLNTDAITSLYQAFDRKRLYD